MSKIQLLDSHETPSRAVKAQFRYYRKTHLEDVDDRPIVVDTQKLGQSDLKSQDDKSFNICPQTLRKAVESLHKAINPKDEPINEEPMDQDSLSSYTFHDFPGK